MLSLEIHGVRVRIDSEFEPLLDGLKKDFGYFSDFSGLACDINVRACLQVPPWSCIPGRATGRKTRNATIHDDGQIRYCTYKNEALAIIDFAGSQPIEIFSPDLNRLHEVTYLVILSRVGKLLDRQGLHRIHAMGVSKGNTAILLTTPMGGGKTTLFLELLRDPHLEILSDDSPFISRTLEILPFPLRVGLKGETLRLLENRGEVDLSSSYTIDRMRFGKKTLLPITSLNRKVALRRDFKRIILLLASRTQGKSKLRRISWVRALPALASGMVIGVGLPIMREYFVEGGREDYKTLVKIAISRLWAALALARRSETYAIALGPSHESNAKLVEALLAGAAPSEPVA